jgi:hypothetical protein
MTCKKCGGTDFYKDGRCKPCCRLYTKTWKKENRWAVKLQKGRANRKRVRNTDARALRIRIASLRREADWLESLLMEGSSENQRTQRRSEESPSLPA